MMVRIGTKMSARIYLMRSPPLWRYTYFDINSYRSRRASTPPFPTAPPQPFAMKITGLAGMSFRAADTHSRKEAAIRRLSSGLRIQRAADDAAGAATAVNLETHSKSQRAVARNVESAIGLMETTEQALASQITLLQSGRALAIAAASDTMAEDERAALQVGYSAFLQEVERIANATESTGIRPLVPAVPTIGIGLVVDTQFLMSASITALQAAFPSFQAALADQDVRYGVVAAGYNADPGDNTRLLSQMGDGTAGSAVAALRSGADARVDTWTALTEAAGKTSFSGVYENDALATGGLSRKVMVLITRAWVDIHAFGSAGKTEAEVGAELADAGWEVHVIGRSVMSTTTPIRMTQYEDIVNATGGSFQNINSGIETGLRNIANHINDTSDGAPEDSVLQVRVGIKTTEDDVMNVQIPTPTDLATLQLSGTSIATAASAQETLDRLDIALQDVQRKRSRLGGVHRRLLVQHALSLQFQHVAEQSRSIIEDASHAHEVANHTREVIQARIATATFAQARRLSRKTMTALLTSPMKR